MKLSAYVTLCVLLFVGITSCKDEDPRYVDDVVGTYISSDIDSNLNGYDEQVATLLVTEVNNTRADITISFDNELIDNLNLNSIGLSDGNGDDIDLDQEYENATALGFVSGDSIRLKIEYHDGDYIEFGGRK